MPWRTEKTDEGQDLVYDQVERGIAVSPTQGTANIQNANIATETGEALASYGRTNEAQVAISGGTLTASVSDGATLLDAPSTLKAGTWIKVTASSVSSITAATNPTTVTANYLIVGGGGGGGASIDSGGTGGGGGGGGAGGMLTGTNAFSVGSTLITVGAGATATTTFKGTNGEDSSIAGVATATGGGGGGTGTDGVSPASEYDGANGGSGGGGGGNVTSGSAGTGTGGQGSSGGTGRGSVTMAGGGGGGATGTGGNAASGVGGAGGAGTASSISGTSVTYAGGGGGASSGTPGAGGAGGGGAGGDLAAGTAGTDGKGGGGGGGNNGAGGAGGDGVVIISYVTGSMYATGGTITYSGGNTIHTFTETQPFTVVSIASGGLYYVSYKDTNNKIKLSEKYDPTGANAITHGTSGTVTFDTLVTPGSAIAKATERYTTATATEYRYYIMDSNCYVWVYDTAVYDSSLVASGVGTLWMLPDPTNYSTLKMTGLAVLNGWVLTVSNSRIYGKATVNLGTPFVHLDNAWLNEPFPTHTNYALVGSQGKMYYCDGNYLGELFPTTSLVTSIANIQSYATYTASTTTGTISAIIGGSAPYSPSGTRIPVVFFTDQYGTMPTAITQNTVYYIGTNIEAGTFNVYAAITGGARLDIATGATGNQYFNTFYPLGTDAGIDGTHSLVQFSSQRLNLPFGETAQCLVEVGNVVMVGCSGNIMYPWNQIDATPSDVIALPEGDVRTMVNVNNMVYAFAGNKGNIYITNTSVASGVLKVPDYCAGVPGTPLTYIEPYFTWGDSMYLRGRVYFSILDQTATKEGNCGGVWSFIPTQNFLYGQDVGIAPRLENQNSHGSYSGVATVLLPNQEQNAVSPQYWSGWQSSYSVGTSTFGIDNTATTPVTTFVIETDAVPTGTALSQDTFIQVEYKLGTQLASGDSVQLYYRTNLTDAWTSCGAVQEESSNRISGYFSINFQKTQWVQFRAVCTTNGTTTSSFVRFKQIRLR